MCLTAEATDNLHRPYCTVLAPQRFDFFHMLGVFNYPRTCTVQTSEQVNINLMVVRAVVCNFDLEASRAHFSAVLSYFPHWGTSFFLGFLHIEPGSLLRVLRRKTQISLTLQFIFEAHRLCTAVMAPRSFDFRMLDALTQNNSYEYYY